MFKTILFFLSVFYIFSTHGINKQALDYLEKLRQKEYAALQSVCSVGGVSEENVEKIIQFYKDFKHIHAKKFFSEKNPDFFHDPKLAEFPMGDSNVLEETKKILRECGINPESISIRYQERAPDEKEKEKEIKLEEIYPIIAKLPKFITNFFDKIYKKRIITNCANAYVAFAKNYLTKITQETSKVTLDNFVEKLHPQIFHQELVITKGGISTNYSYFRHSIEHEASHLLEGHLIIYFSSCIFSDEKLKNDQKFSALLKKFCYRQEVIADVRRYFDSANQEHLLNALRALHIGSREGKRGEIHPSIQSTYKRLQKINQLTWKIPFYKYGYFELGENALLSMIGAIGFYVYLGWRVGKKLKWIRD